VAKSKNVRLLIVDDEESVRSLLSQVLIEEGFQVTTAENANEAWEIFKKDPVPLVITDIAMQGMTGIELLMNIKKDRPKTQVIIMTCYTSQETVSKAHRYGAYDYLIKPFEDLELIPKAAKRAIEKIDQITENELEMEKLKKKIEDLEQSNNMLKNLAIKDGLTGLFNHRYFQENLALELLRSDGDKQIFSMMFIAVDAFTHFKDTFGKIEGDKLLLSIGQVLKNNIRKVDLPARYEGARFEVLLPSTTKNETHKVANKLCKLIADDSFPSRKKQSTAKVTVSIGISSFPIDGTNGSTLIKCAEQAMFQAQISGGNIVCVTNTQVE
jgi:diguanylate cyclase (GGDEF)-like protein